MNFGYNNNNNVDNKNDAPLRTRPIIVKDKTTIEFKGETKKTF